MLCRVALVGMNVSEEGSASIIRVTGIVELGTTLDVTSNRHTQSSLSPVTGAGTQKSRLPFLLPEAGERFSFQNVLFSRLSEFRAMDKVQKPTDSECYIPTLVRNR
jgi:hypothetical protein